MKRIYSLLFIVLLCNIVFAQKKPSKPVPAPKQPPKVTSSAPAGSISLSAQLSDETINAWMAYMTPGKFHTMLASFNGEWKEEVTFWMTADAPPSTSSSKCTNQMIMGDRYQESNHIGTMNGMDFEGRGYLGYDNAKKVFVSTWFDNMGTGIMNMEGSWDEKAGTIHFSGSSVDPIKGKDVKVREEFKIVDNNNQLLEMYMTQNEKEFKSMEIKFTR